MPESSKKISKSTYWPVSWLHLLPFGRPELEPLTRAGFREGGIAEVATPFRGDTDFTPQNGPDMATIWIPLAGTAVIECARDTFTAPPGTLAVRPGFAPHRLTLEGTEGFRHLYFRCRNPHLDRLAIRPFPDYALAHWLSEKIHRDLLEPGRGDPAAARDFAAALTRLLVQALEVAPSRLDRAVALLIARPQTLWTPARLARKLGISTSLLYARCREEYGAAPSELIRKIKMRQADELLAATGNDLETIARLLGYSSAFAFSKAYFKTTGRRPGRSRR